MQIVPRLPFSTQLATIHSQIANAPYLAPIDPPPPQTLREKFIRWFQGAPNPQTRNAQVAQRTAFIQEFESYLNDRWGVTSQGRLTRVAPHESLRPEVSDILMGAARTEAVRANLPEGELISADQERELDQLLPPARAARIREIHVERNRAVAAARIGQQPHRLPQAIGDLLGDRLLGDIPVFERAMDAILNTAADIRLRPHPVPPGRT